VQVIPGHKFHGNPAIHGQWNQRVGHDASVFVPFRCPVTVSFPVIQRLYAPSAGNVIFSCGDFQVGVVAKGPYRLYQSLAVSLLSHNDPPFKILDSSCHDLRGRRRPVVYQYDQRSFRIQRFFLCIILNIKALDAAPGGNHHGVLGQEDGKKFYGFVQ